MYRPAGSPIINIATGVIAEQFPLWSYAPQAKTLNTGIANVLAHILYDSKNRMAHLIGASTTAPPNVTLLPGAARAEGRLPFCMRVQGRIEIEASTWAVGNTLGGGIRLGVFEQDSETGLLSLPADYTMFVDPANAPFRSPATWANEKRLNLWEKRYRKDYSDGSVNDFLALEFNRRIRVALQAHECLAIFHEAPSTSVNARVIVWCRTWVSDEG